MGIPDKQTINAGRDNKIRHNTKPKQNKPRRERILKTKTALGEHNGWPWEITISKSPANTYTAKAVVSVQGHSVMMDFPVSGKVGMAKIPTDKGSYLSENPYEFIVDYVEGFIDGRNEMVAQLAATKQFDQLKEIMRKDDMQPSLSSATPSQVSQMKEQVTELVDRFGASGIAHLTAVCDGRPLTVMAVRNWVSRGRISATWAHKLCQLDPVADAGFTREKLRPDVKSWVQVDYPLNAKA